MRHSRSTTGRYRRAREEQPDEAPSGPTGRIFFDTGSERLPANSIELVGKVADLARSTSGATVEIIDYYPVGDTDAKALATRRVDVGRHAIETNGVTRAQLRAGATAATPGEDARAAGRVDLWVR